MCFVHRGGKGGSEAKSLDGGSSLTEGDPRPQDATMACPCSYRAHFGVGGGWCLSLLSKEGHAGPLSGVHCGLLLGEVPGGCLVNSSEELRLEPR